MWKKNRSPPSPSSSATSALSELLRGVKGFIVWAGASVAGITAILYAVGYLVARAHLSMLGLYEFVDFGNDFYLQEGAKFFVSVSFTVANYALIIVACSVLAYGLFKLAADVLKRFVKESSMLARRPLFLRARTRANLRRWLYPLSLAALVKLENYSLDLLQAPLGVRNLLYVNPQSVSPAALAHAKNYDSTSLRALILVGNKVALESVFHNLLLFACVAAALTLVAWEIVRPWQPRAWLILPFVAAMTLHLITLPMDYGVLVRPTLYPRITLTPDSGEHFPVAAKPFLLSATKDAFVAWDPSEHRIIWIPSTHIAIAQSDEVADLFGPDVQSPHTQGEGK
jgi:hypothetical protein